MFAQVYVGVGSILLPWKHDFVGLNFLVGHGFHGNENILDIGL